MGPLELINLYKKDSFVLTLNSLIENKEGKNTALKGLSGGLKSLIPCVVALLSNKNSCFILENKKSAMSFYYDLKTLIPNNKICFFPDSQHKYYDDEKTNNTNLILRNETIEVVENKKIGKKIIVTCPEGLFEKTIGKKTFREQTFIIKVGQKITYEFLENKLLMLNFEQKDFVENPGQYSIRGQVFDVFSFSNKRPCRISFKNNTIKKINTFNAETQLSINTQDSFSVLANSSVLNSKTKRVSLLDYLNNNWLVWIKDMASCGSIINDHFNNVTKVYNKIKEKTDVLLSFPPENNFLTKKFFYKKINAFKIIEFGSFFYLKNTLCFDYESTKQPDFNKNFIFLEKDISKYLTKNYKVSIAFQSEEQSLRLKRYFESVSTNTVYDSLSFVLTEGFVDQNTRFVYYTDHQIFNRFFKHQPFDSSKSKRKTKNLIDYNKLSIGDYVVHIDHGVGRFLGLNKILIKNINQEAIKIAYQNNDLVYVGVNSLHKFSKYVGDNPSPKLNKLGSFDWVNKKKKIQKSIKNITKDLVSLYAQRKLSKGFSYLPDDYLQFELESSFVYQDTPDQTLTTKEIKKDMESSFPMDRLICGDVGFGKTEVAIRAAFKAVCNNKQVLVLVPTTILALQHYNTFSLRLEKMPIKVGYLSRFRSKKEVFSLLDDCKKGVLDILIGTQRAVNKDVVFKNLGLLIVDEEQKFGVALKEKIKKNKVFLDTLTLTATPIPRTLHFSLIGVRDISVIETPPPNRIPIRTEIISFNKNTIRDVIQKEINRFGQVFFVNNRVENIYQIAGIIQKLIPDANIGVAHGQLKGRELEKIMIKFIEGYFDVLVSTNIIESGLDVPNANTVIINQAHAFGLSDLHQIRGRVGRSNKKAFCYLIAPKTTFLSANSRRRLIAIEELSKLGDGLKIALKDLDIRGAGNLLGGEQSGFINDLGFDMYHKILDETIEELKEKKIIDTEKINVSPLLGGYVCLVEVDVGVLIPTTYISNHNERLLFYSNIDQANKKKERDEIKKNMRDRFGPLPTVVKNLFRIKEIKKLSSKLGFNKIIFKKNSLICYFKEKSGHNYYDSKTFSFLLNYVKNKEKKSVFKKPKTQLTVVFKEVFSIKEVLVLLKKIHKQTQ